MELTPDLLTDVEFPEQWRGYKKHDVDEFLERVASAIDELLERLGDATARVAQAERQLVERSADEEEIRRTLVLAQRAATLAVEEAKDEAARLRDEAAERAIVTLEELEQRKSSLQAELEVMTARVGEQRATLRAELQRYLAELEAPAADEAEEPGEPEESDDEPAVPPEPEPEPVADDELAHARDELVEALRRAGVEPDADGPTFGDEPDDFLAELRKAITDDSPLGPRDDD